MLLKAFHEVFERNQPVTFVYTGPDAAMTAQQQLLELTRNACFIGGNLKCTFAPTPDPSTDLDSGIPTPSRQGLTIHGPDTLSVSLMQLLRPWFDTYKTSSIPDGMKKYNARHQDNFVWFEFGPGDPWK
jgi:hypothetical protein